MPFKAFNHFNSALLLPNFDCVFWQILFLFLAIESLALHWALFIVRVIFTPLKSGGCVGMEGENSRTFDSRLLSLSPRVFNHFL